MSWRWVPFIHVSQKFCLEGQGTRPHLSVAAVLPPSSPPPPAPRCPGPAPSGVHRSHLASTGQTMEAAAMTGYKLEPLKQSRTCSSVTSGRAWSGVPQGSPAWGLRCRPGTCRRDSRLRPSPGSTACAPCRGHRHHGDAPLCSHPTPPPCPQPGMEGSLPRRCDPTAGRWGLVVSQEQYEAAARCPRPLPGAWASESSGEGPGGQASSLGSQTLGCHCCQSAGPVGAGLLGGHRGLCRVGVSRFGPPSSPASARSCARDWRWPSTCALRSSSGA